MNERNDLEMWSHVDASPLVIPHDWSEDFVGPDFDWTTMKICLINLIYEFH